MIHQSSVISHQSSRLKVITEMFRIPALTVFLLLTQNALSQATRLNVSYGTDPEQVMDIYIPDNEDGGEINSKVIVLIHGGGWSNGNKEQMNQFLEFLQAGFPDYTIANINYRLGSVSSPGYTKQLQDIESALEFLENDLNVDQAQFASFGVSAGAHLSILYANAFDKTESVKAVVNIVGPTDFTDPFYALNPVYNKALFPLFGPYLYSENPAIYNETSPVTYVTSKSRPTISFYGLDDPLVPPGQGPRLQLKLNRARVYNKLHWYVGGHYANWSNNAKENMKTKIVKFLSTHF